jgi:hypothetical protein
LLVLWDNASWHVSKQVKTWLREHDQTVLHSSTKGSLLPCVECPICLAVRDIKLKGDRVKFPSHPKRMTATPNHGLRWVKKEIPWRLSE